MVVYAVLRTAATVYVLEEASTSIGRDESCDLRLGGRGVSRVHAELIFVGPSSSDPTLTDLGSSNGTFVNGDRLRAREPQLLHHGDTLHFSAYEKTSFRFELPGHKAYGDDGLGSPPTPPLLPSDPPCSDPAAAKEPMRNSANARGARQRAPSVDRAPAGDVSRSRHHDRPEPALQRRSSPPRSEKSPTQAASVPPSSKDAQQPRRPSTATPASAAPRRPSASSELAGGEEATLAAVQKAVGHLEDLFKRVQEAGKGIECSRVDKSVADASAAQASGVQGASGNEQAEQLSALLQRAERLAVIHVPRELVRLEQLAASGADSRSGSPIGSPAKPRQSSCEPSSEAGEPQQPQAQGASDFPGGQPQQSVVEAHAVLRTGTTVYVLEEQLTSIGRDDACDLCLGGRGVSRFHAEIIFAPGQSGTLRDLGSSNGTFVNSERLRAQESRLLAHGDILHFSAYEKTSFRFELPGHSELEDLSQEGSSTPPPAKAPVTFGAPDQDVSAEMTQLPEQAGEAPVLLDTQVPWKPRKFPTDAQPAVGENSSVKPSGGHKSQAAEGTPHGGDTPNFGPSSSTNASGGNDADENLPVESTATVPAVRRAVERLEDVFSRLQEDGGGSRLSQPEQAEGAAPASLDDAAQLQALVERAERLASLNLPSCPGDAASQSDVVRPVSKPGSKEDKMKPNAELEQSVNVNDMAEHRPEPKARCEAQLQQDQHYNAGLNRREQGMTPGEARLQPSNPACEAADLRRQLAAYEGMVPAERQRASLPAQGEESAVGAELQHWQNIVSSKDTLNRSESSDVLGTLLRAERALAELKRSEVASNRRWTSLTEEARLLKERSRALDNGARKLRERSASVLSAAGEQRQKLWTELDAQVAACGDEEQHLAATRVREELDTLANSAGELQSKIATLEDEEEKCTETRLRAQRRCALLEKLSSEGQLAIDVANASVDEIVDLEVENERLQWQLYHAEKSRESARRLLRERPAPWTPAPSACPAALTDGSQALIPDIALPDQSRSEPVGGDSLDCTNAQEGGAVTAPRPGELIEIGADEVSDSGRSQAARDRPEVAELRKRLSLSRDARRELDRASNGGSSGRSSSRNCGRPPIGSDPAAASQVGNSASSSAVVENTDAMRGDLSNRHQRRSRSESCGNATGGAATAEAQKINSLAASGNLLDWPPSLLDPSIKGLRASSAMVEAAVFDKGGPSDFWGDAPACEEDTLGVSASATADILRSPFDLGGEFHPRTGADRMAAPVSRQNRSGLGDSLDRLCEQPAPTAFEPLGRIPVDVPNRSIRPGSTERRAGPAAAAGALTVSGAMRPPASTPAYPQGNRNPSDSWGSASSPAPSVPIAPRPPLARAPAKLPHYENFGGSPSDAWSNQGPHNDVPGTATFGFAEPLSMPGAYPLTRPVPRPVAGYGLGGANDASGGGSSSAGTAGNTGGDATPSRTFITQSALGNSVQPTGPGPPAGLSTPSKIQGASGSAYLNASPGDVRSVRLELDDD